jgi:hypothetical protein
MSHIKTLAIVTLAASAFATSALAFGEGPGGGGGGPSGPGTASAGSAASGNVDIYGHVDAKCDITNDPVTLDLGEISQSNGQLDTGAVNNKTASLTAWCNGAGSKMAVSTTRITLQGAHTTPTGFADAIDYTATATVGAASASDSTTANPNPAPPGVTVGAFTGSIQVKLTGAGAVGGSSLLMLAGNYHGTTTVTLSPGL